MIKIVSNKSNENSDNGLFSKLKIKLQNTRIQLSNRISSLFVKNNIDENLLKELEILLIKSDIGVKTTEFIINKLKVKVKQENINDGNILKKHLKDILVEILQKSEQSLIIPDSQNPFVMLIVGVNGAGKTTTIGKLAKMYQMEGKKVMLAAGDTFRAAAIQQLQFWGKNINVPVIKQHEGADSASVIFDASQAAMARNTDIVIADTAGRLHTQENLMNELK